MLHNLKVLNAVTPRIASISNKFGAKSNNTSIYQLDFDSLSQAQQLPYAAHGTKAEQTNTIPNLDTVQTSAVFGHGL